MFTKLTYYGYYYWRQKNLGHLKIQTSLKNEIITMQREIIEKSTEEARKSDIMLPFLIKDFVSEVTMSKKRQATKSEC